ncbi:MAG: hypothetical protein VZS44_08425 [Bacilli bacterium]|nr:hypothetical protein [Bacilli bacterium]
MNMSKLHFLYPEDNKELINSIQVKIDDVEYVFYKNNPQVLDIAQGIHHVIVYGTIFSDVDVNLDDGELNVDHEESLKEWFSGDIMIEEADEYYIFKTPFLLNFKGKLKKVNREEFEKRSN